MSQTYIADIYAGTHTAGTDMQNIENNFAALKSSFSGTTSPANAVAGQWYLDTTNYSMKYRNSANNAWYGVMHGDADQKVWVYRDSAMSGWVVDSSVSDKVLALKGGTTYTAGGGVAGSWTHGHANNFSVSNTPHLHQVTNRVLTINSSDQYYNSSGVLANMVNNANIKEFNGTTGNTYYYQLWGGVVVPYESDYVDAAPSLYTSSVTASSSLSGSITDNSTFRPAAATGTLQYMDLS